METIIRETWLSRKPRSSAGAMAATATGLLVIGSVLYWRDVLGVARFLSANNETVFARGEIWRMWTTLLVHANEKHLLANCFLFFIIGSFLNGYFGFLIFPFMAFLFGGLTNLIVLSWMPPNIHLIGASGIVFWLGGAWLALYFLLDRKRTIYQRTLRVLGVGLVLFMPAEAFDPNVSYMSHLIGFVLGVLSGLFYFLLNKSKFRSFEVLEVVYPPDDLLPPLVQ